MPPMGLTKRSRCANLGVGTHPDTAPFRQLLFGLRALAFGDAGALCISGCATRLRFLLDLVDALSEKETDSLFFRQPVVLSVGVHGRQGLQIDKCSDASLALRHALLAMLSHTIRDGCSHRPALVSSNRVGRVG